MSVFIGIIDIVKPKLLMLKILFSFQYILDISDVCLHGKCFSVDTFQKQSVLIIIDLALRYILPKRTAFVADQEIGLVKC